MANNLTQNKVVLVEGNHDRDFFEAWCKRMDRDIQVEVYGGKSKLSQYLGPFKKKFLVPDEKEKSLIIVRDADVDSQGALKSVQDALKLNTLPQPPQAFQFIEGPPKAATAILPDWVSTSAAHR